MTEPHRAIIALGSNIGDKTGYLRLAIARLEDHNAIRVTACSNFYRTEPWGEEDQDWFVNACVEVTTTLAPYELLRECQAIENDLGRVRQRRWGPRVIDVDILVYADVEQTDPALTLPHPRITERAFVLVPLNDLDPDLVIKNRQVSRWLADIDTGGVLKLQSDDMTSGGG